MKCKYSTNGKEEKIILNYKSHDLKDLTLTNIKKQRKKSQKKLQRE